MHKRRAAIVATLALVAAVLVAPTAAYANATSEWEWGYQWPTYGGNTYADATASNGHAVEIWEGDVDNDITNSGSVGYYVVRAKGLNCSGSPVMRFAVDGNIVLPDDTINVGTTWTDFRFYGPWSTGLHNIVISLQNPYGAGGCYRSLKIDKVTAISGSGFITRTGASFYLNSEGFRFVGYNAFGMQGCDYGSVWTTAQIQTYFDDLSPNSVVRVWAMDGWGSGVTDINKILSFAREYQQKVILVLGDGRNNCEQDGAVSGTGDRDKTDTWYKTGYASSAYKTWVGTIVNAEKNDPSVFAWEILNEPGTEASGSTLADSDMRSFLDAMASYIKGIDSNHLVSSGSQATYVKGTSDFAYVHGGSNIDFGSTHEYDLDNGGNNISPEVATDLTEMQSISKPLIVGETGLQGNSSSCRTLATRASLFSTKISTYLGYTGLQGIEVWDYVKPSTKGGAQTYPCSAGDYYTGTGDTGLLSVVNSANIALHP